MLVFSIISTKGGVGKTIIAANLGGFLADAGLRTIEDSSSFVGLTAGYITASQHYGANVGSGSTNGFNVGAYFTSLYDNDTYLNFIAKYSYYSNDFTAIDTAGDSVKGDTSTRTLSALVEVGYKHTFENIYLEPFAQFSLTRFSSNTLKASNDLTVKIDSYNSLLSKIGINVGFANFDNKNTLLYFKTAIAKEFLVDIDVTANDIKDNSNFKNHWFSSGFGMTSEFAKNHHLYSDIEFTYGGKFKNT